MGQKLPRLKELLKEQGVSLSIDKSQNDGTHIKLCKLPPSMNQQMVNGSLHSDNKEKYIPPPSMMLKVPPPPPVSGQPSVPLPPPISSTTPPPPVNPDSDSNETVSQIALDDDINAVNPDEIFVFKTSEPTSITEESLREAYKRLTTPKESVSVVQCYKCKYCFKLGGQMCLCLKSGQGSTGTLYHDEDRECKNYIDEVFKSSSPRD